MNSEVSLWISIFIAGLRTITGVVFIIFGIFSIIRSSKHPECLIALTVLIGGIVTFMTAGLDSSIYILAYQAYPDLSKEIEFMDLNEILNYIRIIPQSLNLGSGFLFAYYLFKKYGVRVRILSVAIPVTVWFINRILFIVIVGHMGMHDANGQLIASSASILSYAWNIVIIGFMVRNLKNDTVFNHLYIFNILGIVASAGELLFWYFTYDAKIPAGLVFLISFLLFSPLPFVRNVYIFNSIRRAKDYFAQPKTMLTDDIPGEV